MNTNGKNENEKKTIILINLIQFSIVFREIIKRRV